MGRTFLNDELGRHEPEVVDRPLRLGSNPDVLIA